MVLIKQGKIEPEGLKDRKDIRLYYLMTSENNDMDEGLDKKTVVAYKALYSKFDNEINLTSIILNDLIIVNILSNGFFSARDINCSIENYIKLNDGKIIPWKVIYKFDRYDDQMIYDAIYQINSIFENKKEYDIGNVLHFISAIFFMEDLFRDELNLNDLNEYIDDYINYLYENTDCFLDDGSNVWFDHIYNDSHGFEYYSKENDKFIHIKEYIENKVITYTRNKEEKLSLELEMLINNNVDDFFRYIDNKLKSRNIYNGKPIFKYMNEKKLASIIIDLDSKYYGKLYELFLCRYSDGQLFNNLKGESPWFKSLIENLKCISDDKCGLLKLRIDVFIHRLGNIVK